MEGNAMILPSAWSLPNEIQVRFGQHTSGRQRAMHHDGHLLLVLHKLPEEEEEEADREAAFFWREPDGKWHFSGRGNGLPSLKEHVQAFEEREDALWAEYRVAEDAEDYFALLEKIAPMLHAAKNLHATLQSAREAVQLDRDIIGLRDEAYEVERGLELLYRDTKNALDFGIARESEEQAELSKQVARAGHRLNILAALFFPLTAVSSIFGMNLRSGLEGAPTGLFWVVLLLGVLVGFAMNGWVLSIPKKAG